MLEPQLRSAMGHTASSVGEFSNSSATRQRADTIVAGDGYVPCCPPLHVAYLIIILFFFFQAEDGIRDLTVTGVQTCALPISFACALSNIYTFGPTFRAENSNTARHAAEFWMIEPEMAFCDLQGDMDLGEEFIKEMARYAIEQCAEDLALFGKFVDKGLHERLKFVVERPFVRVPYTEAIEILNKSGKQFEFPESYGQNLQSEHERFLTEEHFKSPTTVYNYPREIKPFYMRLND